MQAPLTTAKLGSTRCPGCEEVFALTSGEVIEVESLQENRGRVDSTGSRHRGIGTHLVTRRWHRACLEAFEEQNAAYRQQVEQDRLDMIRSICEASGLDYEEQVAKLRT